MGEKHESKQKCPAACSRRKSEKVWRIGKKSRTLVVVVDNTAFAVANKTVKAEDKGNKENTARGDSNARIAKGKGRGHYK